MHGKKIINNSIVSVLYKIIVLVLGFFTRKIFIVYIGEELLGLNSLYANLLELLNLAELGIGVAVQYQLYQPIVEKDNNKIGKILGTARSIYNYIGCIIILIGFLMSFSIQFFIKETTYPMWFVRTTFIISFLGIGLGYFYVYKRLFLIANEDIAIINIIDMIMRVSTVTISLLLIILFKNYFLYLVVNMLNGLISNILISFYFEKKYSYIRIAKKRDFEVQRILLKNLKQVVPIKLSNYVYNSTDNIVISKILGLLAVAKYTNYMTLINAIMGIEYLIGNVIMSSMGKLIHEKDKKDVYDFYMIYEYIQFLFTNFCTVSLAILCEPFIKIWLGEKFIIDGMCFLILILDFFVHSMYQPAYVLYGASGQFEKDKFVTIISAIMNIVISVFLALKIGLVGVVVGTFITDIFIWIVRSKQIVDGYFEKNMGKYTCRAIKYICITLMGYILTSGCIRFIQIENFYLDFCIRLLLCCLVVNILAFILTRKSSEFRFCKSKIKKFINN